MELFFISILSPSPAAVAWPQQLTAGGPFTGDRQGLAGGLGRQGCTLPPEGPGQPRALLTCSLSWTSVSITTVWHFHSHTILQKSSTVCARGPWVAMK